MCRFWGAMKLWMMEGKWGLKNWEIMSSIVNKAPLYPLTRDEMWRIWCSKLRRCGKTFETHQQEQMFYEKHEGPHETLLPCVGWYRQTKHGQQQNHALVTTRRNKILEKLWLEEDTNNMRNQHKSHFAILFVHHPLNLLSPQESHEPNYDISHQHSAMRQRQKRVKFWWANLHKWSLFLPAGLVTSEKAHLFLAGVQPFAL